LTRAAELALLALAAWVAAIVAGLVAGAGGIVVLSAVIAVAAVLGWARWALPRYTAASARAEEAARDLDEFREQIVITVSHEVRTPLTVIQGLVSTLVRRWDALSEPERLDLMDSLALNVASLDTSILHFVDASRIARGQFPMTIEPVDLASVLADVQSKLSTILAGHGVHVTLDAKTVCADREALARVLEHLLSNAVRFSLVGKPIFVRAVPRDGYVEIAVTDRGAGIPDDALARVWEPFWRGDVRDTGVSRGAGLGLTIVRELTEAHGGTAAVTWTAEGKGTTVAVTFPNRC
jgi:signal transduction histidine kinase